jgi:FkbM family methyltransferase
VHPNVVLIFHKGDQRSVQLLLETLVSIDDGLEATYYLQYGDALDTLEIGETLERLKSTRKVVLTNELPNIRIPEAMIVDDPNQQAFGGNHTRQPPEVKWKILQWNLALFKYLIEVDNFLVIEPDCLVLKEHWLRDIFEGWIRTPAPIFGHLKRGRIAGKSVPTHFAGCSVYDCKTLQKLPLERYFFERYQNPWWPLRLLPDTSTANNAFWGPAFSGYDISYDYFLYALYLRESTGSNNPRDWPEDSLTSREDLILCDFRSQLTTDQIVARYYGRLPLLHGVKDDVPRHRVLRLVRENGAAEASSVCRLPLGGRFDIPPQDCSRPVNTGARHAGPFNVLSPDNSSFLSLCDLRGKFQDERCFIIANGPSLRKTDLTRLRNEFTIGLNRIYLNYDNIGFQPTFYCCVNPNVTSQFAPEIDALSSVKFIGASGAEKIKNHWNVFFMKSIVNIGFSESLSKQEWYEGWTVTYCAMQVAYHLGFGDVFLVGVDHYYKHSGEPNLAVTAQDDDPNHFHPDYFGKGVVWQYPDLARSEQSYARAREIFERAGRHIFDATIGGHLQIFEKIDYQKLFAPAPHRKKSPIAKEKPIVSVIMAAHDCGETIRQSIMSVQEQDYSNWELLVINDLSRDDTEKVVSELQASDKRIRLVDSDGIGTSAARNTGMRLAVGEFITFLDSDDILYPGALRSRVKALKRRAEWSVVTCSTQVVDNGLHRLGFAIRPAKSELTFGEAYYNVHPNSLLGRAAVLKRFTFDSEYDGVEDWVFVTRLLRSGIRLYEVADAEVAYRIRPNSVVTADMKAHEERARRVIDLIYGRDPQCPDARPEYEGGLTAPIKEVVLARRQVQLLTYLVLGRRLRDINLVLAEIDHSRLEALSKEEVKAQIRMGTVRFLCCPFAEWRARLSEHAGLSKAIVDKAGLMRRLPKFSSVLLESCGDQGMGNTRLSRTYERGEHAYVDETKLVSVLFGRASGINHTMVDVGAHFGGSGRHFVNKEWRIYCFEPDPANREKLIGHFGGKPNVTIDPRAVSDKVQRAKPFFSSAESTGISALHPFRDTHRQTGTVDVTTISAVVEEYRLDGVDFLKVDAEGADFAVLQGVPWDQMRPAVILCEFEDAKTVPLGYRYKDIADFLVGKGYIVYVSEWHPIVRYGVQHDWCRMFRYPGPLQNPEAWGNLLAFRVDPGPTAISEALRASINVRNPENIRATARLKARQSLSESAEDDLVTTPASSTSIRMGEARQSGGEGTQHGALSYWPANHVVSTGGPSPSTYAVWASMRVGRTCRGPCLRAAVGI